MSCIVKNTMAEMRNLSAAEIADLQNGLYQGVCLLGYYVKRDTPGPIIYHLSATANADDGGSVIVTGGIKLEHNFAHDLDVRYFGVKGNGTYDDTPFILSYFNYANQNNLFWVIPGGFKVVVKSPFDIKNSGRCDGKFILTKETSDVTITVARKNEGEVLDISSWNKSKMTRGSLDVGFINLGLANLHFYSDEVLVDRDSTPSETFYNKREFIRTIEGKFTTPLVCSYKQGENDIPLKVTKFVLEDAIYIEGLSIETAGTQNKASYVLITRDNVTLNNVRIINTINNEGVLALELHTCADVIVNNPFIKGFRKSDSGYGIANFESIGVVINDGNVIDCRHGYTGRNSVDVTINRGVWEEGIDDHWTDRFTANETIVKTGRGLAAFQFAGNDITLNSPIVNGSARIFFGIRLDTPSLGGVVHINNPVFTANDVSEDPADRNIYLFSYTTPNGNTLASDLLLEYKVGATLPESLNIINPIINTDADKVFGFYLGVLNREYINLKNLKITDTTLNAKPTTIFGAVQIVKDSVKQLEHGTTIEISGRLTTNAINTTSVYLNSVDHLDYDNRAKIYLTDCFGYRRIVFSGASLETLIMDGGSVNDFNTDYTYASYSNCNIQFKNVEWKGGTIDPITHALFQNCVFTGNYVFSFSDSVSWANNVKYSTVTGLPLNIVNNMKPPFA
ncbi:hypothetical protein ACKW6Q_14370 [Chryseobacterium kwangjuense]|uniref:Right handed beta helix domain-containing protein n=1 Tax=Chryseobacterium kwangjuense TaxID=267125 RepID=A0ABW9K7J2_9FLAO